MDRQTLDLTALGFQAVITALLALVYAGLWRQERQGYLLTWAAAWTMYVVRLGCISAFLVTRQEGWLFAHQMATGGTALLLLLAALQFSQGLKFERRYLWTVAVVVGWAYVTIGVLHNFAIAGASSAVVLSAVTLWTGWVFWRSRRRARSVSATLLAWTFTLWGLHHLDYPFLRPLGSGALYGVFADVLFIVATAVGTLFLALSERRHALEARNAELEQLTHLLLRAQEEERRRIARELHDEAGQILTAVKIELDLDGRTEAGALVGRALSQLRDVSNLLRPTVLDDLGLLPALRSLVEDFGRRSRIAATIESAESLQGLAPELEVALYRVVQEALTNVARHAGATTVRVTLRLDDARVRLTVADDGRGLTGDPVPNLGLLGMRERVAALAGTLDIATSKDDGFRLGVTIPLAGVT